MVLRGECTGESEVGLVDGVDVVFWIWWLGEGESGGVEWRNKH